MSNCTNLFSPRQQEKNGKRILKYSQQLKRSRRKKSITLFVVGIENLKSIKDRIFSKKALILSIVCSKCYNEVEKNI